jgi:hypothetical protein
MLKKFWYSYRDGLFIVTYFAAWVGVPTGIGAAAGLPVADATMIGVGTLFVPGLPILGKLIDRPRFLRYVSDDQGCYVSPVQAGWQLRVAYRNRDGFPGDDHHRYAAALVPGDTDGITRLVIGCWEPGHRVPYIYSQEQINVGSDLTDELSVHIGDRLAVLRDEAFRMESASFDCLPDMLADRRLAELARADRQDHKRASQHIQRQLAKLTV